MAKLSFWDAPESLQEYGASIYLIPQKKLGQMIQKIHSELSELPENVYFFKLLEEMKNFSFTLGVTGMQSTGKSTLFNGILKYPLLPVCQTTTTSYALDIIYGDKPSIAICYEENSKGKTEKKEFIIYITEQFSSSLFQKLKEYACDCVKNNVLSFDSLQYFIEKDLCKEDILPEELLMDSHDPKHITVLLLILLDTYVGQNSEKRTASEKMICEKRKKLFNELHIPKEAMEYSLRLTWKNDILYSGVRFSDLPGLDSIVEEHQIDDHTTLKSHNQISMECIQLADAVLVLFSGEAVGGSVPSALNLITNSEKMKNVINKGNRIIPVVNKADLVQNIDTTTNSIRNMLQGLDIPFIYPIASWWGEYEFLTKGFPFKRTIYYKKNYKNWMEMIKTMNPEISEQEANVLVMEKLENGLKNNYTHRYEFHDKNGKTHGISLEEFINLFTRDYIDRLRCLKGFELISTGLDYFAMIVDILKSRAELLQLIRNNGKAICQAMMEKLDESCQRILSEFSDQFSTIISELTQEFQNNQGSVTTTCNSFQGAIKQIDKDVASTIKASMGKLKKDFLGNYVIDREGNEKAKENKKIFDSLNQKLENYPILSYLNSSNKLLIQTVTDIYGLYMNKVQKLYQMYQDFPEFFKKALNTAYDKAVIDLITSEPKLTKESFDANYKNVFERVVEVICTQVNNFSNSMGAMLNGDNRVQDIQQKTIDAITSFSSFLEEEFRKSFAKYVKSAVGETFWNERDRLNVKGILKTVDEPFFKEEVLNGLSAAIKDVFNDYREHTLDTYQKVKTEFNYMNTTDLSNSIKGMKNYTEHTFDTNNFSLDAQIEEIEHWITYIVDNLEMMKKELFPAFESVEGFSWASDELKHVYQSIDKLESSFQAVGK